MCVARNCFRLTVCLQPHEFVLALCKRHRLFNYIERLNYIERFWCILHLVEFFA